MGTAFTKEHLDKILRYKCKVILNLDQDEAGVTNTIKIGDELLKNNIDSTVIVFEDYKDSDEFISKKGKVLGSSVCKSVDELHELICLHTAFQDETFTAHHNGIKRRSLCQD